MDSNYDLPRDYRSPDNYHVDSTGPSSGVGVSEVVYLIARVAIAVWACSIAPEAFGVGVAGAVLSCLVVPLTGKLVELGIMGASVAGGIVLTPEAYAAVQATPLAAHGAAALPAVFCTLCGYYLSISLYYEIKLIYLRYTE